MRKLSSDFLRRLKLLVGLSALAGFLFVLPSRFTAPARVLFNELTGPIQTRAYQLGGNAAAAGGTLVEITLADRFKARDRQRALEVEADALRNENIRLREELARRRADIRSMERLAVLAPRFKVVRAQVGSYDASAARRSITVRAGSRHGIRPGLAVTAGGALVGVVTECGRRQSRVRLITDPTSALPCRLMRGGQVHILQGTGGETCRLDWMDNHAIADPGDVVLTSSLSVAGTVGLRLPDGMPAAKILRAERDRMRPLFLAVEAAPLTNLNRLECVEVLVPLAQPATGPAG